MIYFATSENDNNLGLENFITDLTPSLRRYNLVFATLFFLKKKQIMESTILLFLSFLASTFFLLLSHLLEISMSVHQKSHSS